MTGASCVYDSGLAYVVSNVVCRSDDDSHDFRIKSQKVDVASTGIGGRAAGIAVTPGTHYYIFAVSSNGQDGLMLFDDMDISPDKMTDNDLQFKRKLHFTITTDALGTGVIRVKFAHGFGIFHPKILFEDLPQGIEPHELDVSSYIPKGVEIVKVRLQSKAPPGVLHSCSLYDKIDNEASSICVSGSSTDILTNIEDDRLIYYKNGHSKGHCTIVLTAYMLPDSIASL
jgi:hypothetical protein